MKGEFLCVGVIPETWFKGEKEERDVKILNLLDKTMHNNQLIRQTIDYVPAEEELETIDVEKLDGAKITIGVSDIMFKNSRLKLRGRLDVTTLPPGALRNGNGAKHSPPSTAKP